MKALRRYAAALAAIVMLVPAYLFSRPPSFPPAEAVKLAGRFHFDKLLLPEIAGAPQKFVRQVHPSLQRISAWVSISRRNCSA